MDQPVERRISREEAWALVDPVRWAEIHAIERAEQRARTPDDRLLGLNMLMHSWPDSRLGRRTAGAPVHGRVEEGLLPALVAALADVGGWLEQAGLRSVYVGGVAVSLLAKPRYTEDVDVLAMLPLDGLASPVALLPEFGLRLRDPEGGVEMARQRGLLLHHVPTEIDVDILAAVSPFHEDVVRLATKVRVCGLELNLPRPEDLIILKAFANRGQDQIDIGYILDLCEGLDLQRVRRIVGEVAAATAMPEILEDLERLIALAERQRLKPSPSSR